MKLNKLFVGALLASMIGCSESSPDSKNFQLQKPTRYVVSPLAVAFHEEDTAIASGPWKPRDPDKFVLFGIPDLNRDGKLDLIFKEKIPRGEGFSYRLNTDNKIYGAGGTWVVYDPAQTELDFVVNDIDGDGLADILTMKNGQDSLGVELFVNGGEGSFEYSGFLYENKAHRNLRQLTVQDYDQDGKEDILLAEKVEGRYEIRFLRGYEKN